MLPELAVFLISASIIMPLLNIFTNLKANAHLNLNFRVVVLQSWFLIIATMLLVLCFVFNDFSIAYVASNSNSSLSLIYKLTAVWGGHEGSFLLWVVNLSIWNLVLVIYFRKHEFRELIRLASCITGVLVSIFALLMLLTANPFVRLLEDLPFDGADLNPLLQDAVMTIHPPILYFGYVGNVVIYAMVIAGLWLGSNGREYYTLLLRALRAVWACLTLGIALGSFWAYYELGWGGWWFWDPVENAALMPWLCQIAAMHALMLCKKQIKYQKIAECLIILTFALSVLGTFLVRSGLLSSVHAFASDSSRGVGLIIVLLLSIIPGIWLLLNRSKQRSIMQATALSLKQKGLLINMFLLLSATVIVFIGTWYPLFDKSVVVGYPYYNAVFIPIIIVLMLAMLITMTTENRKNLLAINVMLSATVTACLLFVMFKKVDLQAWFGTTIACSIIVSSLLNKGRLVMRIAHIGFAITVIGVSITPCFEIENDLRLKVGDKTVIADYTIQFNGVAEATRSNHLAYIAEFSLFKHATLLKNLFPEKRIYTTRDISTAETAIWPGLLEDISVTISSQFDDGTWAVRLCYKPFIRFIWLGALIMSLTIFSWRINYAAENKY